MIFTYVNIYLQELYFKFPISQVLFVRAVTYSQRSLVSMVECDPVDISLYKEFGHRELYTGRKHLTIMCGSL